MPASSAAPDDALAQLLDAPGAVDPVSSTPAGLTATTLPVLHDAQAGTLTGHLARTNTQWRDTVGEVLVIVRGPDAYVSPSWYATRAEHGRVVRISRIVATWKTSQNRSAADVDGVVAGLSAQGEAAATAVRASHPGHRG